jgi:hypothetical protein
MLCRKLEDILPTVPTNLYLIDEFATLKGDLKERDEGAD